MKKLALLFSIMMFLIMFPAIGQNEGKGTINQLVIIANNPGPVISKDIYGHFSEHLGACIYGGIWVGRNSSIPNTDGIRNDVLTALRAPACLSPHEHGGNCGGIG